MSGTTTPEKLPKRILLSGVFGPFGVDDAYGRKENIMELFHNQVTKAQEMGSWRFQHRSFGLYFLAANTQADVTVLDFPSRKRFMRELEKGYDVVYREYNGGHNYPSWRDELDRGLKFQFGDLTGSP